MKTMFQFIAVIAIMFLVSCQKESQNFIPQRINAFSVDGVDSTQCTMLFSSTSVKPSTNRTIASGSSGVVLFSDSVTTFAGLGQPQGGQLSFIKFIFPNTAGTNLDFSTFKLWLLNGTTLTSIAFKASDGIQTNGDHYIDFSGLEDSTTLGFSTSNVQLIKLTGKVTGASGETFKTKVTAGVIFVNGFGSGLPNVSGVPLTCSGLTTIQ